MKPSSSPSNGLDNCYQTMTAIRRQSQSRLKLPSSIERRVVRIADRRTSRAACKVRAVPVLVEARACVTITFDFAVRREPAAFEVARTTLLANARTLVELRAVGTEASLATVERVGRDGGAAEWFVERTACLVHSTVRAVERCWRMKNRLNVLQLSLRKLKTSTYDKSASRAIHLPASRHGTDSPWPARRCRRTCTRCAHKCFCSCSSPRRKSSSECPR